MLESHYTMRIVSMYAITLTYLSMIHGEQGCMFLHARLHLSAEQTLGCVAHPNEKQVFASLQATVCVALIACLPQKALLAIHSL